MEQLLGEFQGLEFDLATSHGAKGQAVTIHQHLGACILWRTTDRLDQRHGNERLPHAIELGKFFNVLVHVGHSGNFPDSWPRPSRRLCAMSPYLDDFAPRRPA